MDGAATGIGGGSVADLGNLERWWNNPGIAAWSFVLFGCFLLNATLLLAFLVRPGLRTISNRLVDRFIRAGNDQVENQVRVALPRSLFREEKTFVIDFYYHSSISSETFI